MLSCSLLIDELFISLWGHVKIIHQRSLNNFLIITKVMTKCKLILDYNINSYKAITQLLVMIQLL